MTDELISKTEMLNIIDDERFTVDRKFERLRGLKGQSGEWINLNEAKEHFKYISSLDKEQILHILDRLPTATVELNNDGDLISRADAIMHFVKASKNYECGMFDLEELTHELWQIPSAQPKRGELYEANEKFVRIVRCGECKYADKFVSPDYVICELTEERQEFDEFCSSGELKDKR